MKTNLLILCAAASALHAGGDLLQAIRDGHEETVKRTAASSPESFAIRDERGLTPLHYAAAVGTPAIVAAVLEAKADVNATSKNGATPLLMAVRSPRKVDPLLKAGANVNAANEDGVTPLIAALNGATGRLETVKLLLARGADTKAVDRSKRSIALLAYRTRDPEVIAALEVAGAKVEKLSDLGDKPLFNLGSTASIDQIRTALDLGASPNEIGQTLTLSLPALAQYSNRNRLDAVKLLLERGADVNLRGNKGHTALMTAAAAVRRSPDMVRALLKAGADPNIVDAQGQTALDWARKQGETELAAIIREAGGKPGVATVAPAPLAEPRTTAAALEKAVPLLVSAGATSIRKVACVNCHNNSLPAVALKTVRDAGRDIPADAAGHHARAFE
ncbi:MAG: hypothetical protein FJW40_18735 [Acidobacteria bacterium]|nr:hypothetical protein [Acidobacteriota bacterium]